MDVIQVLNEGFEVRWILDQEKCRNSTWTGGRCGYNWTVNQFRCFSPSDSANFSSDTGEISSGVYTFYLILSSLLPIEFLGTRRKLLEPDVPLFWISNWLSSVQIYWNSRTNTACSTNLSCFYFVWRELPPLCYAIAIFFNSMVTFVRLNSVAVCWKCLEFSNELSFCIWMNEWEEISHIEQVLDA